MFILGDIFDRIFVELIGRGLFFYQENRIIILTSLEYFAIDIGLGILEDRTTFKIDLPDVYQHCIDIIITELQVKVLDDPNGTNIRQGLVAEYSIIKLLRY